MVITTNDGPSGVCQDFLAYGNFFHQIGRTASGFDHAFYLEDLDGGQLHSNRFHQIHGGWAFHGYPRTKNVEITRNYLQDGLFAVLYEDVANSVTGNSVHHNAWRNTYSGINQPPVLSSVSPGSGNTYATNAGSNTNTAYGGSSGLGVDAELAVTNNLVADPQFVSPSTGNFTIGNSAVATHIGTTGLSGASYDATAPKRKSHITLNRSHGALIRHARFHHTTSYAVNEHGYGTEEWRIENCWFDPGTTPQRGTIFLGNSSWGIAHAGLIRNNKVISGPRFIQSQENSYEVRVIANTVTGLAANSYATTPRFIQASGWAATASTTRRSLATSSSATTVGMTTRRRTC
jgi:hypothetical protein